MIALRLESNKQQLDYLKNKSDAGIVKLKAKRKEIDDIIDEIKSTDGVSLGEIVSTTTNLDWILSEMQSLLTVNHHLILLKDILDEKSSKSKQLMASRFSIMDELRKKMLAWEDQFDPEIDKKKALCEDLRKQIEEKKTIIREMEKDYFNKKVLIEQKKSLKKDLDKKLEKAAAANLTSKLAVKELDTAWLAACRQQSELDQLIQPFNETLAITEKSYSVLLNVKAEIELSEKKIQELENAHAELSKEEIELDESYKNYSDQAAKLSLGIDTRKMMFDKSNNETMDYISKLAKHIEEADTNIMNADEETAKLVADNENDSRRADFIEKEFEMWKNNRDDDSESDEESELDSEIADARAKIKFLKEQASLRGANFKKSQDFQQKRDNETPIMGTIQTLVGDKSPFQDDSAKNLVVKERIELSDEKNHSQVYENVSTEEDKKENLDNPVQNTSQPISNSQSKCEPLTEISESILSQNNEQNSLLVTPTQNESLKDSQPLTIGLDDDCFTQSQYFVPEKMEATPIKDKTPKVSQSTQEKKRESSDDLTFQKSLKKDEGHLSPKSGDSDTDQSLETLGLVVKQENPTTKKMTTFYMRPQLTPIKSDYSKASTSSMVDAYFDIMGSN
ncbi:paramyosin-like [Panonychus citri]|uniref:paramyosin-like n=1 Tax=Panonychus citri TaxID=50023 RepID=UPI002307C7DA|nr:paramyosin-like [Panonychus citri]